MDPKMCYKNQSVSLGRAKGERTRPACGFRRPAENLVPTIFLTAFRLMP